jgi:hypothetical protein
MPSLPARLWYLEGTVGRGSYAICGVVGFLLKYMIDWSIARLVFGRPWSPWSYWWLLHVSEDADRVTIGLFLSLFAVSVPFLWFGMTLTLLRLRSAGKSAGWAAFFFVPVFNLVLFLLLVILPPTDRQRRRDLTGTLENALFAVVLSVGIATLAIALATRVVATYGFGLFIAVPFSVGYLAAYIQRRRHPTATARPFVSALLSLALLGGLLLALAWEGLLCLVMAAPLAIAVAVIGAYLGARTAGSNPQNPRHASAYACITLLPLAILAEPALQLQAPIYRVDTSMVINALPATVWRNVVIFPPISAPPEWYFRAGIAYPLRAHIDGAGVGAVRYCEFTTGDFVEPITAWDESRLLRFNVVANPAPMKELSLFKDVAAPHLDGHLVSQAGQFELIPLSNGRTLLVGSTWYQHHLWPAAYWRIWSDTIIHRIHLRVLRHIKESSEHASRKAPAAVDARQPM